MTGVDPGDFATASLTDVGRVRQANEDSCGEFLHPSGARLFVVADGMGGHRGGATASQNAVRIIGEAFAASSADSAECLTDAIRRANADIHQLASETPELRGMGTTVVCLLLVSDTHGLVAHVGDSRLYRYRDDVLEPLTEDHSVVAAMVRQGIITAEEAESHPRRNEILRSVGVEPTVEIDVNPVEVTGGDVFLLCSDGLTGMVPDAEIVDLMYGNAPQDAARSLVEAANEAGGTDNISVQVIQIPAREHETAEKAPLPAPHGAPAQPTSDSRSDAHDSGELSPVPLVAFGVALFGVLVGWLLLR